MNWNNPEDRLALVESVGVEEYNRQLRQFYERNSIKLVNGHEIRQVSTRFGLLYMVGDTGIAYDTLDKAVKYAEGH